MKKQKLMKNVHATQDQELIDSFQELMGVNTDDFEILNRELLLEEEYEEEPIHIDWNNRKMRA